MNELFLERLDLAKSRISEIENEHLKNLDATKGALDVYFHVIAEFLLKTLNIYGLSSKGDLLKMDEESRKKLMEDIYSDIIPEHYGESFANPTYAVKMLGQEYGRLLSSLYYELRSNIAFAYEKNLWQIVIRLELFLEIYYLFSSSLEEDKKLPSQEKIRQIMYYFYSDYEEECRKERFASLVEPSSYTFAKDIIMNSDLSDVSYLYLFGEYIGVNEIETARHLNNMSDEEIEKMASTYTEGYRIGFEVTGKDLSIKKTVAIRYNLGFERMVKAAVIQFRKMGLEPSIYRANPSTFYTGNSINQNGFACDGANKQYLYDHKDDNGLFLDKALINRKFEALKSAGEEYKDSAKTFAGPAVIEVFGEKTFTPVNNEDAVHLDSEQSKELGKYRVQAAVITNDYIPGDERSFTIIAFPVPSIGDRYEEIFNETVKLNTLDYKLYQRTQQTLIDALDKGDYVHVKGMGQNKTDIVVKLHELKDASKETNFENCVADVNIPVGEVFTSPVLKNTNGTLYVSSVYLNGLLFKDLTIEFKDGVISSYSCSNFDSEEENKKYIDDNILFHHDTLPIGEFAIGTNTTAYVMARKFDIQDKLPILIAEKTGPHFAVGDTCYSHEEDIITRNPDGKNIIARSNEISDLRDTDPEKAYFGCHTDITIPYNELGEITVVTKDGDKILIIQNGRFVLEGTQELNKPFEQLQ
ncbi:aminopeptidase [Butyrivibrio sp. NC3005]|uniref:aminopeptidase n=1 Tax=Butyrivibrio sp. NC3005 TaxID=1280685 RepID=UPI0004024579|nr:aminopeptidase [Butyrivibrio sp. NC3005]